MYTEPFWTAMQRSQGLSNLIYRQSLSQEKKRLKLEVMSTASLTLVLVDLVQRLYSSLVSQASLLRKMMDTWYSLHMMKILGNCSRFLPQFVYLPTTIALCLSSRNFLFISIQPKRVTICPPMKPWLSLSLSLSLWLFCFCYSFRGALRTGWFAGSFKV